MHDAGTMTRLFVNEKEVCRSMMIYNNRPHYLVEVSNSTSMPGMDMGGAAGHAEGGHAPAGSKVEYHISDPGLCEDFGTVKAGDRMHIEAMYDAEKYGLMTHNGEDEPLMGNMRVYMGPDAGAPAVRSGGMGAEAAAPEAEAPEAETPAAPSGLAGLLEGLGGARPGAAPAAAPAEGTESMEGMEGMEDMEDMEDM